VLSFDAIVVGLGGGAPDSEVVYESEAGLLSPEEAIRAHLEVAANHGARLHCDEQVGWC